MTAQVISLYDTFSNFIAGFGTWKDKATQQTPSLQILNPNDLMKLYRGDWLSRKIVDIPAFDATRAWRQWQAEQKDITLLEKCEMDFGIQRKVLACMTKARLYGGACMVLGVDQGAFYEELDVERVGKGDLKFVHVVSRWMLSTGAPIRDITSPYFGEPNYYLRSNVPITPAPDSRVTPVETNLAMRGEKSAAQIYIHPSRVIKMDGLDYPDLETAPDAWSDSVLQTVYDTIQSASLVHSSISSIISEAKLDIIKVGNLTELISAEASRKKLVDRFQNANAAKSIINALLLDKDNEEWEQHQVRLMGMDKVLMMFMSICSAASDIPATRLLGKSPDGQNATGDSDTRNYYDRISSEQKMHLTPLLSRLDDILIRHTFGSRPDEISSEWRPLWQESNDVKAKVALAKAQAHKIDVDNGLINPDALRIGRQNDLTEDGFLYPGFDQALAEADKAGEFDVEEHMDPMAGIPEPGTPGAPPTDNPPTP